MTIIDEIIEGLKKPGKSKSGLAKALGIQPSGVTAILSVGKNQKPRQIKAGEVEKIRAYFADGESKAASIPEKTRDRFTPTVMTTVGQSGEMPLYRFANGGKGSPILEQIPFETVHRPESLARVRDPYGVMIEGTSMVPEYRPGWVAHVDPNLIPMPGDTCVFRGEQADGSYWACIKVLRKETPTHWHVEQHNPPKGEHRTFTLKKTEYQVAHVTVGTDKRRR